MRWIGRGVRSTLVNDFITLRGNHKKKWPYIESKLHTYSHNNYESTFFVNKFTQRDKLETFYVLWDKSFSSNILSNGNYEAY